MARAAPPKSLISQIQENSNEIMYMFDSFVGKSHAPSNSFTRNKCHSPRFSKGVLSLWAVLSQHSNFLYGL